VRLVAISFGLAAVIAACGGGGEESPSPTGTVLEASVTPTEPASDGIDCQPYVYVVQPGDTLSEIALRFDVSLEAVAQASSLADPDALQVDQELTIPCPVSDAEPVESTTTPAA
jgi:LysM repeat protein